MARGDYSARVVLNRQKMDQVLLAVADGVLAFGQEVIEQGDPPDAEPYGEGLVTRGGVLVYWENQKVGGWGQDGKQPKKPRAFRVAGRDGISAAVGWGFPGRFQEFGTVHHRAQPFFVSVFNAVGKAATTIFRRAASGRLRRI